MKNQLQFIDQAYNDKTNQFLLSENGLLNLKVSQDDNQKNINWTCDKNVELPIRLEKSGRGATPPFTLIDAWRTIIKVYGRRPAIHYQDQNKKWITETYQQYYDQNCEFASALIALGVEERSSVNIIGFNSKEWFFSFFGAVFANCLPVGVYTTNESHSCHYIAEHSEASVIVVENYAQLKKYLPILKDLPLLKAIIMYKDKKPNVEIPVDKKLFTFEEFIAFGKKYSTKDILKERMNKQKPGHACNIIYTSGTTGNPKGVLLSHDNYTWCGQSCIYRFNLHNETRIVSYLPLSHVAACILDMCGCICAGAQVFFAQPTALKGTIIETLKYARPTFFVGVPRLFEKIEESIKFIASKNNTIMKGIGAWAKAQGIEGTYKEVQGENPGLQFNIAKSLIYNKIKQNIGFDQIEVIINGAAPVKPETRKFFLRLNMKINNCYGMTETTGPNMFTDETKFEAFDNHYFKAAGQAFDGNTFKIINPKNGNGEICVKGRNRFMGYFKNEEETRNQVDSDGFYHTQDVGSFDKNNNLSITGRIKEILITAGGENVQTQYLEDNVRTIIPIISNVLIIGDQRKFLTALITLKFEDNKFPEDVLQELKDHSCEEQNVEDLINNKNFEKYFQKKMQEVNKLAISRAQQIRKWTILKEDFTIDKNEVTPTQKLRKSYIMENYKNIIEEMYIEPKL